MVIEGFWDISVDQLHPSGHIFGIRDDHFAEFDASGALVGTFGRDLLGVNRNFAGGVGTAYDPATDRIYASDIFSDTVKIFGGLVTGTAPDASTEAASEVEKTAARLNGKVNPQGVPSVYHF